MPNAEQFLSTTKKPNAMAFLSVTSTPKPTAEEFLSTSSARKTTAKDFLKANSDEQAFQNWYKTQATKLGLSPDPDDPQHFYDYRAAFRAGAKPDETGHWPSTFKLPEHPNRYVGGVDTIQPVFQPTLSPSDVLPTTEAAPPQPSKEKYGWKDWLQAYPLIFGEHPEQAGKSAEEKFRIYQKIDKQVAEPAFEKAAKIASWAALAIYGYAGIKAIPELWRMAKGALSKPLTPQQRLETAQYLKDQGFKEESKTIAELARKFPEIKKQLMTERVVTPSVPIPSFPSPETVGAATPATVTPTTPPVAPGVLAGEAGKISFEPIATGMEALEAAKLQAKSNVAAAKKVFTRFDQLAPETKQSFINISEGDIELREKAAQAAVEATKDFDDATLEAVYDHLQEPSKHPLPPGTEDLKTSLQGLKKWSFKELNKPFLTSQKDVEALEKAVDSDLPIPVYLKPKLKVPKYPDNQIESLQVEKNLLQTKLNHTESEEARTDIENKIQQIDGRTRRLEEVEYFHQVTTPQPGIKGKVVRHRTSKAISRKPYRVLGREFATRRDALEAGYQVENLPTAIADIIYETNRVMHMDEFIKSINRNPEFSEKANLAPKDWVSVDERLFPAGKYRKYHPAMGDALKEITYTSNKKELTRLYDKINTIGKIIGFYNPIFMTRYNVSQGMRAAGFTWARAMPEAIRTWREKGDTYNYLRRNGLFNNVFDLKPAMTDITSQLRASIEKAPVSEQFKAVARENLNPLKLAHNIWKFLNEGTWKIDEAQRIATWLLLKDKPRLKKHYSDFEIIELANDFHANYGKVPKATREQLNRAIFTPTYKVSMARIVGRMHTEPKALWPSLIRHYAMKVMFNKFLPMALAAYYGYKKLDRRAAVEGYRLITKGPKGKETVYSISDPLLEGTKVLNRPYNRTIEYNLAAVPAALVTILRGPLFQSKDPDWKETVNAFFKTGAPVVKELMLWQEKDKEGFQKFMQALGLAFIYKRNRTKLPKESVMVSLAKALSLWGDWKKVLRLEDEKHRTIRVPIKRKRRKRR
jgi:hypothetical protein